jgi:hypothetical protein
MNQPRILIVGSNAGFGLLAVLTLAQQGHHVIATMRDPSIGEALIYSNWWRAFTAIYYCQRPLVSSRLWKEGVLMLPILATG